MQKGKEPLITGGKISSTADNGRFSVWLILWVHYTMLFLLVGSGNSSWWIKLEEEPWKSLIPIPLRSFSFTFPQTLEQFGPHEGVGAFIIYVPFLDCRAHAVYPLRGTVKTTVSSRNSHPLLIVSKSDVTEASHVYVASLSCRLEVFTLQLLS